MGLLGFLGGFCVFTFVGPAILPRAQKVYPYPHHVPKHPGDATLRFAMVHDVLHERYPKHGPAYYAERNRIVRAELDAKGPQLAGDRYFFLLDDLAMGLEALGRYDESERVLREKLAAQAARGLKGHDLYSTYANLATTLANASWRDALAGDAAAVERLQESRGLVEQSIDVNPRAHFGRQEWLARTIHYMLTASRNPTLLLKQDLIGNRLDEAVDPSRQRSYKGQPGFLSRGMLWDLERVRDGPITDELRAEVRRHIAVVGPEEEHGVPFDEPALAIVGMWRVGTGPNPFFALALGETMLRVGQRYIAWCAYERATRMANFYGRGRAIQQGLIDHCRGRQKVIEDQLPPDEVDKLKERFDKELAFGLRYQQAYARFEEEKIAAGASIEDMTFHDAFHAEHGPIASPVGQTDHLVTEGASHLSGGRRLWEVVARALLTGGVFAFVTALLIAAPSYLRPPRTKA
jgi:hypothetical protein